MQVRVEDVPIKRLLGHFELMLLLLLTYCPLLGNKATNFNYMPVHWCFVLFFWRLLDREHPDLGKLDAFALVDRLLRTVD